jgi:hypothetical protein
MSGLAFWGAADVWRGCLFGDSVFKLEEEGKPALLLLLPAAIADGCVLPSAFEMGC